MAPRANATSMDTDSEFVPTKRQCSHVSVSASGTYGLCEGNLYKLGQYGYLAGAVWGTDRGSFLVAVDAAEEEMASLLAEANYDRWEG